MAITYTADFKGQNAGTAAIVSNTLTVTTGDFITLAYVSEDNSLESAWTVTNTGTAITWTKKAETTTANNTKVVLWSGTAGATPPTTVTVTPTTGTTSKALGTLVHTGAHATTPLPAGNIFTGTSAHNASRSITPTSSGSAMWMIAGDWAATNTFAGGTNCSLQGTPFNQAGRATFGLIRPTTQPRTDALAFTISETDTGGTIAWIAFEVQAAASVAVDQPYSPWPQLGPLLAQ